MKNKSPLLISIISYFFVLLFIYAGMSKLLDFENFQVQLAQSPLLSAYAGFVSYSIIAIEFVVAISLCIPRTRPTGLYASLGLMAGFTIYIYLILNYSDFIPCSCGGILEKLGWREHLIFNIVCVILAVVGILLLEKQKEKGFKRPSFLSAGTVLASCLLVIGMFLSSEHIMKKENNFTRRFPHHPILEDTIINLGFNSYYFAGADHGKIYLGNSTSPQLLTEIDSSFTEKKEKQILLDNYNHQFRAVRLQVKPPYYYLYDGTVPVIFRGLLINNQAQTLSSKDAYFTQLAIIDSSTFALRSQSAENNSFTLGFLNLTAPQKFRLMPGLIQIQQDGIFDTDGKLTIDQYTRQPIYTYYYRNQFLIMDSQLNLARRLNTIDTTSRAKVNTTVLSNGTRLMDAPPVVVNKHMAIYRGILFNESSLKGKHESSDDWRKASVIDMYRTDRQEYLGSFYIQERGKNRISDLLVTDKYLYAIIGSDLIRYRFAQSVTDRFKTGEAENLVKE